MPRWLRDAMPESGEAPTASSARAWCWRRSPGSSKCATIRRSSWATTRRSRAARASSTRLAEMIEEVIESGERALIFSQFAEMGEHHPAPSGGAVRPRGPVPAWRRGQGAARSDGARFQQAEPQGPAVFVLSLKAGGTGLNLTAANHVFHFDRWWNPAVENQATDRAFESASGAGCWCINSCAPGTLEEKSTRS